MRGTALGSAGRHFRVPVTPDTKRRLSKFLSVRLLNPLARAALNRVRIPGTALLETTGRRSGQPRRVPVGDGLRGETFWIIAEHGHAADYVRNIKAHPRVRVKARGRWRSGPATTLADDDPATRLRWLRRPLNDTVLRLNATDPVTIRVDLDRYDPRVRPAAGR